MGRPIKDLTGQTFGYMTVVSLHPEQTSHRNAQWVCQCVCGTERIVSSDLLQRGLYRSCGCIKRAKTGGREIDNLTGQTFGNLLVISPHTERGPGNKICYVCECQCKNQCIVSRIYLFRCSLPNCGCLDSTIRSKANTKYKDPTTVNFNQLYSHVKLSAQKRGYTFNLNKEEFKRLSQSPCHYCGKPPAQKWSHPNFSEHPFLYTGLDRKDNKQGYTLSNTVPCCWPHNRMKGSLGYKEFIDSVVGIVRHLYPQDQDKE